MKVVVDFIGHNARDPLPLRVRTDGGNTRALSADEAYALAAWWNARDKIKRQGRNNPATAVALRLSQRMLTHYKGVSVLSQNWQLLRLQEGDKSFSFRSTIGEFHGRVYQGAMKGDVYWGLKALVPELWACRERVVYDWEIRFPKLRGSEKNTGIGRRLLNFWSSSAAPFALLFEEYVPPELISDLERAYGFRVRTQKQDPKGGCHEEPARDPVEHHAEADPGHREGGSDDREGDAAALGDGQDQGANGLEEVVARVRRPYRRRKPLKARRKK